MAKKFFSTEKRLGGIFFCIYIPLGFANCQPIMYISNVGEYHRPHGTYNYSNEYGLGFANGQPISYIEDVS